MGISIVQEVNIQFPCFGGIAHSAVFFHCFLVPEYISTHLTSYQNAMVLHLLVVNTDKEASFLYVGD